MPRPDDPAPSDPAPRAVPGEPKGPQGSLPPGAGNASKGGRRTSPLGSSSTLSWAVFLARLHLGLLFFMPGIHRVFQLGPLGHARRFFVEPYADSVLPTWSLWLVGTTVPFVELVAGGLLLIGLWRKGALVILGIELAVITFGHLLAEPFWAMHSHVFPRLALLLFLLAAGLHRDRWAWDLHKERR